MFRKYSYSTSTIAYADNRYSMDQAALTGESLPVGKHEGDECFSGSTCKQGEAEGIVIATDRKSVV